MIDASLVQKLREKTGVGMMTCKQALKESDGDMDRAIDLLRKQGHAKAAKRSSRAATEGKISSYIHMGGKIGVLAEINCETDFAAKSEPFGELIREISMQIAASNPQYVKREDVPKEIVDKEIEIFKAQMQADGKPKPEHVIEKMITGKLGKFYKESCLMDQDFVKNPDINIKDHITSFVAKIGENIVIRRFVRFQVGEEL